MQHSRRNFIKQSTLALAAASILPGNLLAGITAKETLGLQLYSVRDDMKTDPSGTLKKLAKMGYKNVEHANYIDHKFYGYTQKEFKKILTDLGLKMPSGHTRMNAEHWDSVKKDFTDDWKRTVDDAAAMGQKYVISPWLDDSLRKNYD
ncbi:MAG: twin-arginine translocation signal domain-containing protein, partial [Bacteroidota bacterium]